MTTAIVIDTEADLQQSLVPALEGGLLVHVTRDCDDHGCECRCVGHMDEGSLVFWCGLGRHHVTFR